MYSLGEGVVIFGVVHVACLLVRVGKSLLSHELSRFRKLLCVVQVQSDGSSVKEDKVIIIFLLLSSPRSDLRLDLAAAIAVSRPRLPITFGRLERE